LRRYPSEYVVEHVRLTAQPYDGPTVNSDYPLFAAQLDFGDVLMYSSDYPHSHYDSADDGIPAPLRASLGERLMRETARSFYRLDD